MEKCLICDREFKSLRSLTRHLTQKHKEISIWDYRRLYKKDLLLCPYCNKNYCLPRGNWYNQGTCGSSECITAELSLRGHKARQIQLKDPNWNEYISETLKQKWSEVDFRAKQSESRSKFWNSELGRSIASNRNKERYNNPKFRQEMIQNAKLMGINFHERALSDIEQFKRLRTAIKSSYITKNCGKNCHLYLVELPDCLKFGITVNLEKRMLELKGERLLADRLLSVEMAANLEYELCIKYFDDLLVTNSKSERLPLSFREELIDTFKKL